MKKSLSKKKVVERSRSRRRTGRVFSKTDIIPKGLSDMVVNSGLSPAQMAAFQRQEGGGATSRIFPKEMTERMGQLFGSGLDHLGKSFARLTVANSDHPAALPQMGDATFLPPAEGAHAGHFVHANAQSFDKRKKGLTVKAGLEIQAANVQGLQPFFHTPGNAQDAYNLPKSYVEQVRWSRLMYNLNPYIHSITDLKAFYAYSRFKLTTSEPWVTQFYESVSFNKKFNLYRFMLRMALSLKKFGEAIVWGQRKQDGVWPQTGQPKWVWDYFILLEPELVEVKKAMMGDGEAKYFLRPNRDLEELVRRIEANDPEVADMQGKIAAPIMKKIKNRELVPLDSSTISAVQYLTDGSAVRGTPPYQCLYVNFIFEDFVRLALMAQANRYHFPIELWTLGNLEKGIMPSVADLEKLRDLVASAIQNPPFAIFFPPILDYKALGVQGTLMNIKDDMEYAHKQYLIGLGVNENMILGDSGIFSSNETAGNQSFIRMQQKDRDEMEEWARWNFYEPLAQWNNLKTNKNGVLEPIVPELEWAKTLDFKAEESAKEADKYLFEQGLEDPETFITAYGNRNPEEMALKLKKAIGGIFDKDERFGSKAIRDKMAAGTSEPTPTTTAPGAPPAGKEGGGGEAPGLGGPGGGGGGKGGTVGPEEGGTATPGAPGAGAAPPAPSATPAGTEVSPAGII